MLNSFIQSYTGVTDAALTWTKPLENDWEIRTDMTEAEMRILASGLLQQENDSLLLWSQS